MRECVKCGAETELPPITITVGPETRVLDLCERHGKPVVALFEIGRAGPGKAAPPSHGRAKGHAVIPVD